MSFFADLLSRAEAELAVLKADASAVEARIEAAFKLGAAKQALLAIEQEATTLEQKLVAAFELGKKSI